MSTLDLETTRSIADIRKDGLDKAVLERIAADRAEMQRVKEEQKERLLGQFVSLKQDKETRTFLFTGQVGRGHQTSGGLANKTGNTWAYRHEIQVPSL